MTNPTRYIDVCNGDADGLCALHQLRLAEPRAARLITGLKHDIALLECVQADGDSVVTVLDLSLDRNRGALERLLGAGVRVRYFDHHFAGVIPGHTLLEAHIDTAAGTCTSMIVDRLLGGRYRLWAIVAAFGDNLPRAAERLAESEGLSAADVDLLRELGQSLNYNSYGRDAADVAIHPCELYRKLGAYEDPRRFAREEEIVAALHTRREEDLARARRIEPYWEQPDRACYVLPDEAWSRRIQGTFAHALARESPARAHAVVLPIDAENYAVSVRAPTNHQAGADLLCRAFPGGGGRKGAAGIDRLPRGSLERFIDAFRRARWRD